jgi:ribonuclease VapC
LIVDTSALIAIIRDEEDAEAFASAIAGAPHAAISAANWFEASMVAEGRDPQRGGALFDATLAAARLEILPVTAAVAARARDAWRAYGKGRHRADLNFGDCFAYALSMERGEPLLFKGDDFAQTDVKRAL